MADNVTAPAVGAILATDEISGVHHPLTKMEFGVDGVATQVSATNPLPVAIISGGGGGGGGDASAANQTAVQATAGADASKAVAVQGVTGGKAISVSGTFWQTTQPVSGTLAATQSGAWNITNITGAITLPSGAATSAAQTTGNASLSSIDGKLTGVSTAANQVTMNATLGTLAASEYETVAASQTAQVLGATGATGDFLAGLLVTPATTSPGAVTILDSAISITVFTGGASSVSNLVPFFIPLGIKSVSGAWKVTTGANVSVIGVGDFT